jgi:hypothetical protein
MSKKKMLTNSKPKPATRYVRIMTELFKRNNASSVEEFAWEGKNLTVIADDLGITVPRNISDNIYAIRHGREELPEEVRKFAEPQHWLLLPNGRGKYRFVKAKHFVLEHDKYKQPIKVPDATPPIVAKSARGDEQAVLARVRYNRLLDIFLGISVSALQSHLRTTVDYFNKSQIETDELYVGIDRFGAQYILPVQAKGPDQKERVGAVQIVQDIYSCREKFPDLICRSIGIKTLNVEKKDKEDIYTIALMEVFIETGSEFNVAKGREAHYKLVPNSMISDTELLAYKDAAMKAVSE